MIRLVGLNNDHQGHGSNKANEREDEGRRINATSGKWHLHANF